MLYDGLYEQLINRRLEKELASSDKHKETAPIDPAESSKVLSQYISELTEKAMRSLEDNKDHLKDQVNLTNQIVSTIMDAIQDEEDDLEIDEPVKQLLALIDKKNNKWAISDKEKLPRPETSIGQSSLFTGAAYEPQMVSELKKEIVSCNRIAFLVSFIKWSGLVKIIDELRKFAQNGGKLRVITTSYMGATDVKAIEELRRIPNTEIKVSYDTKRTRLHAKAYIFYRDTGFTTAYVGSSNMSNVALSSGLEWNVKVTKKDLPETIAKIEATFESYWNTNEFEDYTEESKERLTQALKAEHSSQKNASEIYTLDFQPYSYQKEILEKLEAEREVRGYTHNLVVAATGTGKTVISAFDYKQFCKKHPGQTNRLLYVAHREEILEQSITTFRQILKNQNFGELFVGRHRPEEGIDHLFISVQTLNSKEFTEKTTPDFYDYIVVDEFHHAAAPTYQKLLNYYQPKILLGLTATPERMDGKDILPYFDNRIAAEIRLPEAIDRKLLCPFQYFGITDDVDLSSLKWAAGGYDKAELENVYALSGAVAEKRADMIISSLLKYVTDIDQVKGLGFCVSIKHAKFMSDWFNSHGIPSMHLTGGSPDVIREKAKKDLQDGRVRFIFVVDIYNEGVDIPEVNTVLFLRPTESLTVFLQQLGRGLRLAEGKECLTVLDFIGQANKKYHFEDKYAALLSRTTRGVRREMQDGFISVPKGCYIQLERVAAHYILDNIRASYGNAAGLVSRIATFEEDSGKKLSLTNFLDYHHLSAQSIYKFASFSRLCERAGVIDDFSEESEEALTKAFPKLASIDSRRWIDFLLNTLLVDVDNTDFAELSDCERRMLQMFFITVWGKAIDSEAEMEDRLYALSGCPNMLKELRELLEYKRDQIDFIDQPVDVGFDCPLDLHCTYTRDQLLIALDYMNPGNIREGVKWLPDKNLDVFMVTLNKTDKDYSPTTMYNDYSINEELFHWQSQSTTTEKSKTGQRYIHHKEMESKILLFVREFKRERLTGLAEAYTYLGTANYVHHEGEKPMNITWKLDYPIPPKFLKKTSKLLVG